MSYIHWLDRNVSIRICCIIQRIYMLWNSLVYTFLDCCVFCYLPVVGKYNSIVNGLTSTVQSPYHKSTSNCTDYMRLTKYIIYNRISPFFYATQNARIIFNQNIWHIFHHYALSLFRSFCLYTMMTIASL